jgi:DNA-binding response OmpR family regulator
VLRFNGVGPQDPAPDYDDGVLSITPGQFMVRARGRPLIIPPRELAVLAELTRNHGAVCTRDAVLAAVWREPEKLKARVVDLAVHDVRSILDEAIPDIAYIHTHINAGYRFEAEPRS